MNYIYFGLFFLGFSFLHILQLFLAPDLGAKGIYYGYAIGEAFLEAWVLSWIDQFLFQKSFRVLQRVFVGATAFLFLIHLIDFPLTRLLNFSSWYAIDAYLLEESFETFIETIRASNISVENWILIFFLLVSTIGFFYSLSVVLRKVSTAYPVKLSWKTFLTVSVVTIASLLFMDFRFTGELRNDRLSFLLPWKQTLVSYDPVELLLPGGVRGGDSEERVLFQARQTKKELNKKPNLFLFVVESLREDFLTEEVAPHISSFGKRSIPLEWTLSAANGTHLSWFSIFQGKHALHWDQMRPEKWRSGSLPLQILKEAGYTIRVYSSARLAYYQMDQMLFGVKLDPSYHIETFHHEKTSQIYQNDENCFKKLFYDMDQKDGLEGNLFIVFLDSTHFHYSWPEHEGSRFGPISDGIDYLKMSYSLDELEHVKNRYKNSIFYLDTLFGSFLKKLEALPTGKEAAVVFTSDHGEEFFEEGCLFHASRLSHMQTAVPIYFQFGNRNRINDQMASFASHVDIFPTVLDYVFGDDRFGFLFDGESIFRPKERNFALSCAYNASRGPTQFLLKNELGSWNFKLKKEKRVDLSNILYIEKKDGDREKSGLEGKGALSCGIEPILHSLFSSKRSAENH